MLFDEKYLTKNVLDAKYEECESSDCDLLRGLINEIIAGAKSWNGIGG